MRLPYGRVPRYDRVHGPGFRWWKFRQTDGRFAYRMDKGAGANHYSIVVYEVDGIPLADQVREGRRKMRDQMRAMSAAVSPSVATPPQHPKHHSGSLF